MTSLVPFYLKNVYNNEPIFENSKIVYSAYENEYEKTFTEKFFELAAINQLEKEDLSDFNDNGEVKLLLGGMKNAHALVKGSESLPEKETALFDDSDAPKLEYFSTEELPAEILTFYKEILEPVS